MKKFTIDNDVFIKLYRVDENYATEARQLINRLNDDMSIIINPLLFQYEFYSIMIRANIDLEQCSKMFKRPNLFLDHSSLQVIEKAKQIIDLCDNQKKRPSFYDAIYHATAITNEAVFITADEEYYNKAQSIGNILLLNQDILSKI